MREEKQSNRQKEIKHSSQIGIGTNLFLFISKFIVSLLSGSVSILSDAFNNLSDCFSSIITMISVYFADKPADKDHPYGHGRSEYIATQFVSFFIIYVGITLLWESSKQIISPKPLEISWWVYGVLILSIYLKGWMWMMNQRIVKKTNSDLIKAVVIDSRNDVIASCLLLLAMSLQPHTSLPIDGFFGLVLSVIILIQGIAVLRNSMSKLLGKKISDDMIAEIDKIINRHPDVLGYHNFKGHDYGPNHIHVSIDLELPDATELNKAHKIVDSIEREVHQLLGVDVDAHIDPISSDTELNRLMYNKVVELSHDLFDAQQITTFYCVKGHYRTSIFISLNIEDDERFKFVKKELLERAKNDTSNLSFHVEWDRRQEDEK